MFPQEMSSILFVCVWSLASVGVGLVCGFFIGRSFTLSNEPKRLKRDREQTLNALVSVVSSTNRLNEDVDTHNNAMITAQQELESIDSTDSDARIEDLQALLMSNISHVVQSNRRLENDLVVTRFKLEHQAQELDRSRKEARTDSLCNVGNRKAVDETLQFMISRYQSEQAPFGLMLIDIDHFKRINDTFGHQAGDEVLTSISRALKECVRPEDFVGRLGGDEFAILLEGLSEENASLVGSRIRATIELYDFSVNDSGQSTVVTMSMGLAVAGPEDDAISLYERADQALYKSKQLGRNRLYTIVDQHSNDESTATNNPAVATLESYEEFKASFNPTNSPLP